MTKMSHFGGYVRLFWGSDGGLRALNEEITPLLMWISEYDAKIWLVWILVVA